MRFTFDAGLSLFKHHFHDDPIVPGALLLDHYATHGEPDAVRNIVNFSNVRFRRVVRPGSTVEFATSADGNVQVQMADTLHCTFDFEQLDLRALPPPPMLRGSLAPVQITPLREPAYWFLDNAVEIDADGYWATCCIDLDTLERTHPWLSELDRWKPLLLIESAGNLVWALQNIKSPSDLSSRYILARFDEVNYNVDCCGWSTRQTVMVHVKRYGSLLVWDAWTCDAVSTQLTIRGAVSRKEKLQ